MRRPASQNAKDMKKNKSYIRWSKSTKHESYIQMDLNVLWYNFRKKVVELLGIREGTDIDATVAGIQKDIGFRGPSVWILIFSILIASIGLNVNSTAVIIGAMLISPLMGPILGIGLGVGTNDYATLIRSLKNIGIAIGISIITSTIYFILTPLDIEQSELLARTKPTLLDVMVGLFGGFAGIIAGSRKEKSNVIPGVAIATALMPPLCTAGFGIATLNASYFFGAFYLFFINSVFIALSTFLTVRYLRFPLVTHINTLKMKKYRRYTAIFLTITILPSAYIFFTVVQETRFNVYAENFIKDQCEFEGSSLMSKVTYNDTASYIDLYYIGQEISKDQIQGLDKILPKYVNSDKGFLNVTNKTVIRVHQNEKDYEGFEKKLDELNQKVRVGVLEDIYKKNEDAIRDKDEKILYLEEQVYLLSKIDSIPLHQINKEIHHLYTEVDYFAYAESYELKYIEDSLVRDTIPTMLIGFNNEMKSHKKEEVIKNIQSWIRTRINNDKLRVLEY